MKPPLLSELTFLPVSEYTAALELVSSVLEKWPIDDVSSALMNFGVLRCRLPRGTVRSQRFYHLYVLWLPFVHTSFGLGKVAFSQRSILFHKSVCFWLVIRQSLRSQSPPLTPSQSLGHPICILSSRCAHGGANSRYVATWLPCCSPHSLARLLMPSTARRTNATNAVYAAVA
jgi:hypothetical protein